MDKDSKPIACPSCGGEIPADAPTGWCPRCALASMLADGPSDKGLEVLSLQDIPPPGANVSYIGDYQLLEVIAHGGMGVVYKARQKSLNRLVALKLLLGGAHASPDFKRRFRQEAELAAKLQHPNIVPIYEVGEHEAQPYFSMEYVAGPDLAKLTREQPLPPKQAAEYVRVVAEAIAYAHAQGVLHRDLKPSNILIGPDDRPRITDFGLARQMDANSNLTASGEMLGTPSYLPPEQASMQSGKIGPRSDVYALGAILYHLLTGRPPFVADTLAKVLKQVLETAPIQLRRINATIPRDLQTICSTCLEKNPATRYESAGALATDLQRFLVGEVILARPTGAVARSIKWIRRHPVTAGLITAICVSVLAGAIAVKWQHRRFESLKLYDSYLLAATSAEYLLDPRRDADDVKKYFEDLLQQRVNEDTNGIEAFYIRGAWLHVLIEKGFYSNDLRFFSDAEPIARQLVSFVQQDAEGNITARHVARSSLGLSLAKQRKYAEAEPLLMAGCTFAEQLISTNATEDLDDSFAGFRVFEALAQLYTDTGRTNLAAQWALKSIDYQRKRKQTETNSAEPQKP